MTEREVTHTKKDPDGDILALCKPGEFWSPRSKGRAIIDILSERYEYYVKGPHEDIIIRVVRDKEKGMYLRTDPDITTENSLDNLPDC